MNHFVENRVSERNCCFFFFRGRFFFQPWNSSEWVTCKRFLGKKKNIILGNILGKIKRKKPKVDKKCHFLPILTVFWRSTVSRVSEWLANFSWFPKSGKKQKKLPKSSEWVPPKLFRGRKQYGTFAPIPIFFVTSLNHPPSKITFFCWD